MHYDKFRATHSKLPYANPVDEAERLGVSIPEEMLDFINVLNHSARTGRYEPNNWLKAEGAINCDRKKQYGSIFRHVAEAYAGVKKDEDSGLDPRLHAVSRLLMSYVRDLRGLNDE